MLKRFCVQRLQLVRRQAWLPRTRAEERVWLVSLRMDDSSAAEQLRLRQVRRRARLPRTHAEEQVWLVSV